jgi:EpsI family protein
MTGLLLKALAGAAALGLNFYIYNHLATDEVIPPRTKFERFPDALDGWRCPQREAIEQEIVSNLGVTDYLICNFEHGAPERLVSLYVGYHETQVRREGGGSAENSIHPPKHCLPGSGWSIADHQLVHLDLPGFPEGGAVVNRLVIAKGSERQLVYYWYHGQSRVIAEDWKKVVWLFWDRASRQRTDGALVRFSSPVVRGDTAAADEAILDLAARIVPELPAYVPPR